MHPALEIRLVRDNLSLAMALSKSTENGLITPLHVLPEENPAGASDGTPAPAPNALSRRIGNQVRASFGFSVLQAQQSLERVYPSSPLTELRSSLKGARCTIYLLSISLRRGMLSPVWVCPPEYRQRFDVPAISFLLDASLMDGTPVVWEQFGGLGKYLDLLDYCAAWVQSWDPESAAPEIRPPAPAIPAPAQVATPAQVSAPAEVPNLSQISAPSQVTAGARIPAPGAGGRPGCCHGDQLRRKQVLPGLGGPVSRQRVVQGIPGLVPGNSDPDVDPEKLRAGAHQNGISKAQAGSGLSLVAGNRVGRFRVGFGPAPEGDSGGPPRLHPPDPGRSFSDFQHPACPGFPQQS